MSIQEHNIQKEVRGYFIVFAALLSFTIVTVFISYLHLKLTYAIILALLVAFTKGSLVACFFMHLISERKLIYLILGVIAIFLLALLLLPSIEFHNLPQGSFHVS